MDAETSFEIRNPTGRGAAIFYAIVAAGGLAVLILDDFSTIRRIVVAVSAAMLALIAVRSWRSRIRVDKSGVTAFHEGLARRLPWANITGFEMNEWRGLGARLANGKRAALLYGNLSPTRRDAILARLEAARVQHSGAVD